MKIDSASDAPRLGIYPVNIERPLQSFVPNHLGRCHSYTNLNQYVRVPIRFYGLNRDNAINFHLANTGGLRLSSCSRTACEDLKLCQDFFQSSRIDCALENCGSAIVSRHNLSVNSLPSELYKRSGNLSDIYVSECCTRGRVCADLRIYLPTHYVAAM